jgi:hypothetical protein
MRESQTKKLLELFESTPVLSVQYIQHKMAINSPRKVIAELRSKGVPIEDRWQSHIGPHGEVTRYKEYFLRKGWEYVKN